MPRQAEHSTVCDMADTTTASRDIVLYLDVDGVLNPDGANPHKHFATYRKHHIAGFRLWLTPEHGAALLALGVRIVWATTWVHLEELEEIAEIVGLPYGLERIDFGYRDRGGRNCGKLPGVKAHSEANGIRRLVWIDDCHGPDDLAWVREQPHNRLAITPHPGAGLTKRHLDTIAEFLNNPA